VTRADLPIGLLLAVACLFILWQATLLPYGSEFAPGPGFAPIWLALLGFILSMLVAINAWRQPGLPPGSDFSDRRALARVGASTVGLFVMLALIPPLGMLLSLLLFLLFLSLAVERLQPAAAVGVSLGTVGFVYLVFQRFLNVPFPTGPLGF
jgi:hypothetical protein